jgi:hypothetical protein
MLAMVYWDGITKCMRHLVLAVMLLSATVLLAELMVTGAVIAIFSDCGSSVTGAVMAILAELPVCADWLLPKI